MRQPLLYGHFTVRIDRYRRVRLPASLRAQLDSLQGGEAFYLVNGGNETLWLYPDRYYERREMERPIPPSINASDLPLATISFSPATRVECDNRGRIALPTRRMVSLGRSPEVSLVGVRDYIEIWPTERRERVSVDTFL